MYTLILKNYLIFTFALKMDNKTCTFKNLMKLKKQSRPITKALQLGLKKKLFYSSISLAKIKLHEVFSFKIKL